MSTSEQSRWQRLWRGWVRPLAVIIIVTSTFRSAVADWHDVPTQSMEPTILVGDRIAVNKLAYDLRVPFTSRRLARWSDPAVGEVVTLWSPANGNRLVKRIAAAPGDTIEMRGGRLRINDRLLPVTPTSLGTLGVTDLTDPPPYAFATELLNGRTHPIMIQPARRSRRDFGPVTIPDGHYFVMGDNRDNSGDSRHFGLVPRDRITGRVVCVALSLDYDNWFIPRGDRWIRGVP